MPLGIKVKQLLPPTPTLDYFMLEKRDEWLRSKTTAELIAKANETREKQANLGACHRSCLYVIMGAQLKTIENILKERS
jgi:hypothetical protein